MTYDDVISRFEAVRSDQIATIYSRRNPGINVWGVRFGDIDKLAKQIKRDTPLAIALWESTIVEARILACRIIDPADVSDEQSDRWVAQIDSPSLADDWAGVVYKTPYAAAKLTAWTASRDEFVRRAGFSLLYRFAADPKSALPDDRFLAYLDQIRTEIHASPNWSREMMNLVPIAIGKRSDALFAPALAAATAYGKVSIFHGDKTNCKIWDAVDALNDPRTKIKAP